MTDEKPIDLTEFFEQFEDCCLPFIDKGVAEFEWSAKGKGFGRFYFFFKDNELICDSEYMSKEFVKKMLCNMVDQATFRD